jgi:hypothetical protein
MKFFLAAYTLLISFSMAAKAQDKSPQILTEPTSWEFEKFPLPPSFATAIRYQGFEELRFAPGMFKKEAHDYFTYVFVAQIDSNLRISQNDVKNYLVSYYRGLCAVTATDRKLNIDTSKITATLYRQKKSTADYISYDATINLFGVFADGAPVKLLMEISVIKNAATNKISLFFIASPLSKTDDVWKELYTIRSRSLQQLFATKSP